MDFEELDQIKGSAFTAAFSNSRIYGTMIELAQAVSRKGFAVSAEEIDAIKKAKIEALKTVSAHFDNIQKTVETRRKNLARFGSVRIASLGFDCFARTVLTRWGFKPSAKLGEPSMPFDLAIHPAAAVEKITLEDFAFYADGSLTLDPAKGYPVCEALGVELNHEPPEWEWDGLRQRYAARAEHFRTMMADERMTVFVHHTDDAGEAAAISSLFEAVRMARGNRPSEFVCIHTPPFGAETELNLSGAHVITQPYPFRDYLWYKPTHTFSLRGVRFEQAIAERLSELMKHVNQQP